MKANAIEYLLKEEEIERLKVTTHPIEFEMYYSV